MLFFLLIYFLIHLLPDLSTSQIGPFHFQAGGHRRQPNLALVFYVIFMSYHIFVCFFSRLFDSRPNKASVKCPSVHPSILTKFLRF